MQKLGKSSFYLQMWTEKTNCHFFSMNSFTFKSHLKSPKIYFLQIFCVSLQCFAGQPKYFQETKLELSRVLTERRRNPS